MFDRLQPPATYTFSQKGPLRTVRAPLMPLFGRAEVG
jgi:hypothetical protein